MRSTSNIHTNNICDNQQFEEEAEALINLVNKLVNQIEERLKSTYFYQSFQI